MIEPWLIAAVLFVAVAYSLVGHGGASGYLALLAFTTVPMAVGSATALAINIAVSGISFCAFHRSKHFDWNLTWPFLVGSIPLAFAGGLIRIDSKIHSWILAATLLYCAFALVFQQRSKSEETMMPNKAVSVAAGAAIGLLSGIVGVGGGIFLSPLLILLNWSRPHAVASSSAVFIFANSIAGLVARQSSVVMESLAFWPLIAAGSIGAIAGSWLGANRVSGVVIRQVLALVLLVAVVKLATKN